MARKNASNVAAPVAAPPVALVSPIAPVAPVVARKRARRAAAAEHAAPVAPVALPPIDLNHPKARDAIRARFPHATTETIVDASPEDDAAALAYMNARDEAQRAEGRKERAGNAIMVAIGEASGIKGEGWEATWKEENGTIDWGALVKELAIDAHVIERFRMPKRRVLRVRETNE